jgi:hypothetical protein
LEEPLVHHFSRWHKAAPRECGGVPWFLLAFGLIIFGLTAFDPIGPAAILEEGSSLEEVVALER